MISSQDWPGHLRVLRFIPVLAKFLCMRYITGRYDEN